MNLGLASLARPFVDGTTILADKATAWVTRPALLDVPEDAPEGTEPEADKRAPVKRLALLSAAGYVVLASDYTTYAVGGGCVAWVVAALAVGHGGRREVEKVSDSPAPPPPPPERPSCSECAGHELVSVTPLNGQKGMLIYKTAPADRPNHTHIHLQESP